MYIYAYILIYRHIHISIYLIYMYIFNIYVYIYMYMVNIYVYIYANFIKHNRHFMSTYFLLDPFEFPYYFYRFRGELIYVLSIVACIPSTFCPTVRITSIHKLCKNNIYSQTILEHQNNKQKLQILEPLHIRNLQPTLNRINFQTSANVLKCL